MYIDCIVLILRSCSKVFITCITQVESQVSSLVEEPEQTKTNDDAMLTGWEEKVGEHGTENASPLRHIDVGQNNPFHHY